MTAARRCLVVTVAGVVLLVMACSEPDVVEAPVVDDSGAPDIGTSPADDSNTGDEIDVPPEDEGDPGPPKCKPWVNCDDSLICTVDTCSMPGEVCVWTVAEGFCLINNLCREAGEVDPENPCAACDPSVTRHGWTTRPDGADCQDDVCQESFTCQAGICAGDGTACDDNNPCTVDACNPAIGCVASPELDGVPCETSNACLVDVMCLAGACLGKTLSCDDGDPCTVDDCLPTAGCTNLVQDGLDCQDGDACTTPDICFDGLCVGGPVTSCEDDNPCSIDTCDIYIGCVHLPTQSACCTGLSSICDDGNPCTDHACDPDTLECAYSTNTLNCDDGDACTTQDLCDDGECGGAPITCDDGEPCTQDFCDASTGCSSAPISGNPCTDGLACSTGDVCVSGACVADDSGCGCVIDTTWDAVKAKTYLIGINGHPTQGLDVDANAATCAPKADCSAGIDNAFAVLGALAAEALQETVDKGKLMLLFQMPMAKGGAFDGAMQQGELDGGNKDCDFQAATCDYLVEDGGLDPDTCEPTFTLPCTLVGSKLSCGGPGTTLPIDLPVQDGVVLPVGIFNVQLVATVTLAGDNITSMTGALGGAIRQDALMAAVDSLDDDGLPLPKDLLKTLLLSLLEYDIDTDGDGTKDGASIGFKLEFIDAQIVGVEP